MRFHELHATSGAPARLKADIVGELRDPLRHEFRTRPASLSCSEAVVASQAGQFTARMTISNRFD